MLDTALRIRDFQISDLQQMFEIDRLCFPAGIAFSLREFHAVCNSLDSLCRVAERCGNIAGFVLAGIDRGRHGHVITLDVIPEERRKGIGSRLMNDLHRILKNMEIKISVLEVGKDNIPARRLYERMQYRYAGILPGYYPVNASERKWNCRTDAPHAKSAENEPENSTGDAYRMVLYL